MILFYRFATMMTSMQAFGFSFLLYALAAQSQPTFPDGVAPILESVKARQISIVGIGGDDSEKVAKLAQHGSASLEEDLVEELVQSDLAKAAYARVHQRLVKSIYVGGCPRDFSGCPKGWVAEGDMCSPPGDYDGLCGPINFGQASGAEQEALAWKCRASFPCASAVTCSKDFSACPETWTHLGNGLCIAPVEYKGMCSPATDFSTFSSFDKTSWSAKCHAQ